MSPDDWFMRRHGIQGFSYNIDGYPMPLQSPEDWLLWCAAPAATPVAIRELSISRDKHEHINHIFVCPRLLTAYWRKQLYKLADLVVEILGVNT
jgi:hypothetical protein